MWLPPQLQHFPVFTTTLSTYARSPLHLSHLCFPLHTLAVCPTLWLLKDVIGGETYGLTLKLMYQTITFPGSNSSLKCIRTYLLSASPPLFLKACNRLISKTVPPLTTFFSSCRFTPRAPPNFQMISFIHSVCRRSQTAVRLYTFTTLRGKCTL